MNNNGNIGKEKKKSHLGYILFLLILIGITFFILLKDQNLKELFIIIRNLNPIMIIFGLISAFSFICCEALVFKTLLTILGEKRPFLQILKYSFVGFYFSSITPSASGGQPMQMYYMKKDNINISLSSLTILITVVIYQIAMILYAIIAFLMNFKFVIEKVTKIYTLIIFGSFINILCISFIIGAVFSDKLIFKFVEMIVKLFYKMKIIKDMEKVQTQVTKQIDEYKQGALLIRRNIKTILKMFIITFFQLTAMYSVPFFVYRAFGLSEVSFWKIIALQSILNIAVSSLPLPGAVGASESVFMLLFKTLFPVNILTSAMLVSRGISYYTLLLISGIAVVIFHVKTKKVKNYQQ